MKEIQGTDYKTFQEVIEELVKPIDGRGLDIDTLKKLYESKRVYLENLRLKCFYEVNRSIQSEFSMSDYTLILQAIKLTNQHLHDLVLLSVSSALSRAHSPFI